MAGALQSLDKSAPRAWSAPLVHGLLLLYCLVFFFYGLNAGDLYRTEGLRAILAAEAMRSGDWVVPSLHGEKLLTKPPGMYIAIVLCSWPMGEVTTWSARVPAALGATACVLFLGWYVARQLGRTAGVLTVLLTPIALAWLDKATAAEIDMLLVSFVAGSIVCYWRALDIVEGLDADSGKGALLGWLTLAHLCLALGILTKWTSPIFFYGALLPFLYLRGQLRLLLRPMHLLSMLPAAGLVAAWVVLAAQRVGWDTLWHEVSGEWLGHVGPSHHHRGYPWGETLVYPVRVWLAALPVSLFALFARVEESPAAQRLRQAFLCWLGVPLLFWTLFPDHDVRQSLPMFPAFGGLAMFTWRRWLDTLDTASRGCQPPEDRQETEPTDEVKSADEITVPDSSGGLRPRLADEVSANKLHPRADDVAPRLDDDSSGGLRLRRADEVTAGTSEAANSRVRSLAGSRAARWLITLLVCWLLVKLAFVHFVMPYRTLLRQTRAKGELLAQHVPAGATLYLERLKDDGLLFYYGRPTQRTNLQQLTSPAGAAYAILTEQEYRQRPGQLPLRALLWLHDQQGEPIVLVQIGG